MGFVQIIEFRPGPRLDDGRKLVEEWENATEGKRTTQRRMLCQDHDDPGRYFNVVFFDSHESAMKNSNLPETQRLSEQLMKLGDTPTFYNLDILDDRKG